MKTIIAFSIFCFLLLFANLNHARKEPDGEHYWKSVMKDQPMPEAIKGLLHKDPAGTASSANLDSEKKMNHFVKDFDSKRSSTTIIYHSITQSKQQQGEDKPSVKELKDQKKT